MSMETCVICDRRPARTVKGHCHLCSDKISRSERRSTPVQPFRFLTYRGAVVGLFPNGGDKLKPRLLRRAASGLPKGRTVNLNKWCDGFDRPIIKRFKACVLQLANA